MAGTPDLFVVCKKCGSEVSPYITECPYCGTRLRKRAPKIDRPDAAPKVPERERRIGVRRGAASVGRRPAKAKPSRVAKPATPRLGRLRSGEIPGIRGEEHARPYATM